MRMLIAVALLVAGCGDEMIGAQSGAVTRDWSVELSGVCVGSMTTSQTDTVDAAQKPYATYYDGSWSCGQMRGVVTGALDARTNHFDILLSDGALSFHAVGTRSAAGLAGTIGLKAGDVPFAAK